jgi:hypothetical protein
VPRIVRGSRAGAIVYWSLAIGLVAFGFLALISIGLPFLLTGLAMLFLASRRSERATLWPTLIGIWAFVLGFVLIAPLGCATTSSAEPGQAVAATTSCGNVLGLDYSGGAGYTPPLLPAALVGIALGLAAALGARRLLRRGERSASASP